METRLIDLAGLQALIDALGRRGYTVLGPTVRDGAIVTGPVRGRRRPPGRLGRRPGRRSVPAPPPRGRRGVRLRRRARSPPSRCSSRPRRCSGAAGGPTAAFTVEPSRPGRRRTRTRCSGCARATCTRSASTTPCCADRRSTGRRLRRPPRGRLRRRGHVLRPRRHLLLRLDGHRSAAAAGTRGGVRPGPDRAARRRGPPVRGRGGQRARRRGRRRDRRCRSADPRRPGPADAVAERAAGTDGPHPGHRRSQGAALRRAPTARCGTTSPQRCLACGNCTAVCPTCFCTTVEDVTDLAGDVDRAHRGCGTPASRPSSPTCTAAPSARPPGRATGSG